MRTCRLDAEGETYSEGDAPRYWAAVSVARTAQDGNRGRSGIRAVGGPGDSAVARCRQVSGPRTDFHQLERRAS